MGRGGAEQEEGYGEILRRAPFPVIRVDAEVRVREWNLAATELFGAAQEQAFGRELAELVPITGGAAAWRELLAEDDGAQRTWTTRRPGQDPVTCAWTLQRLVTASGEPRGAVLYGRNVSARLEDERKFQLERIALHSIIDNVTMVVWIIDAKGTYLYHEGKGLAYIGVQPGQLVGANIFDIFGDNPGTALLRSGLAGEHAHYPVTVSDAEWDNWQIPIRDETGDVIYLVGVSIEITELKRNEKELKAKLDLIERQKQAIRELSTPIIEVWDRVLTLPILGLVDQARTVELMESLLNAVVRSRARFAILDLTGVEVVDAATASHLIDLIQAVRLLGAEGILTGIHPSIADTIVGLDVDLSGLVVRSTLRQGLQHCIARLGARR